MTYDGSVLRLFVNGQQVDERALTGSLYDDGSPLRIGGNEVWSEYFSGLIDEVRVYSRAQSAAEIQADMNTSVGSGTPNPDTTPPTVSAVTPAGQATDVPLTTPVTATFSEAVTDAQFTLKSPAGVAVAGTTVMDATQRVLTFTPAQPLAEATIYTGQMSGARDGAGNAMAGPYIWSFTTGVAPPGGLVAAYGMDEGSGPPWATPPAATTPEPPGTPPGSRAGTVRRCRSTASPVGSRSSTLRHCAWRTV
ncbi:hypothetical protein E1292_31835 [Nonomuraea deserti]|uniref:SbsA Ig-like domain-containing protein n=1 Tax=Nonomuraea deserti TaxID=1848322 RepID=A0A4R4V4B7_9ACTN|nr:Ig-like domain-containing protein [Nonomuraea deserti]TDC99450.1 hypothetical protein E1292_31835 [Nonomuraea deserti]